LTLCVPVFAVALPLLAELFNQNLMSVR